MKPLRSLLNSPASRPEMLDKAAATDADALVIDLEDSVPHGKKAEARAIAREKIATFAGRGLVVYVRVNDEASGHMEDDLDAIVVGGLEGIQLPKVDDPSTIRRVHDLLTELERRRGLTQGSVELLVSLESARGVYSAYDILTAASRVGSVMIGTAENGDLQGDIGYQLTETEEETLYLRSRVLLAARVAGITNPIDGVYADYRNLEGLEATARRARALGYRGKKVIHPAQVPVVNRVFAPTPAELDFHLRVLETFEAALSRGQATAVVDGKMIDYAMAETARRVLDRVDPNHGAGQHGQGGT